MSDEEMFFTEFNSETPAGAFYNHSLVQLFQALPVMREFSRRYQVFGLPTHVHVLSALLDAFQQWSGRREKPRMAIVDWREVPTYSEFRLFEDYFQSLGLECLIVDPRELEYDGQCLRAGKAVIDLIYKRVLISELLERGGMEHPMVRAVRAGHVCMVNGFRCKILFKKASFAVLTDERNAKLFTPAEQTTIAKHIPWTRTVAERKTLPPPERPSGTPATTTVDLIPYICANKDRLVLKPNDDYGGKGIYLGWTVYQTTWEHAVQIAMLSPYIVQERVRLPKEPFPNWIDNRVVVADRMVDTDPFCSFGSFMDGSLCRISTADLLNVTAGGGSTSPRFCSRTADFASTENAGISIDSRRAGAKDVDAGPDKCDSDDLCDLSRLQLLPNNGILVIFPALRVCSTMPKRKSGKLASKSKGLGIALGRKSLLNLEEST